MSVLAMLLPDAERTRYMEEWRAELFDLRAALAPWHERLAYLGRLAMMCPVTAVALRWHLRRALERGSVE